MDDLPHTDPPEVEARLWENCAGMSGFDVGAHLGESVRFFLARGVTRLTLFEADPACAALLAGRYPEHIVVAKAVASRAGNLTLRYGKEMLRDPDTAGLDWAAGGPPLDVPCLTLDDYCAKRGIRPDFVKVDVEGGEVGVALGAGRLIAARHAAWLIEFHSADNLAALERQFDGYQTETVRHPGYAPGSDLWRNHGWLRAKPFDG